MFLSALRKGGHGGLAGALFGLPFGGFNPLAPTGEVLDVDDLVALSADVAGLLMALAGAMPFILAILAGTIQLGEMDDAVRAGVVEQLNNTVKIATALAIRVMHDGGAAANDATRAARRILAEVVRAGAVDADIAAAARQVIDATRAAAAAAEADAGARTAAETQVAAAMDNLIAMFAAAANQMQAAQAAIMPPNPAMAGQPEVAAAAAVAETAATTRAVAAAVKCAAVLAALLALLRPGGDRQIVAPSYGGGVAAGGGDTTAAPAAKKKESQHRSNCEFIAKILAQAEERKEAATRGKGNQPPRREMPRQARDPKPDGAKRQRNSGTPKKPDTPKSTAKESAAQRDASATRGPSRKSTASSKKGLMGSGNVGRFSRKAPVRGGKN
jgi:hypothetical protein